MRLLIFVSAVALTAFAFAACDPEQSPFGYAGSGSKLDAAADATALRVDAVDLVSGIEDGVRDPAVVALNGAGIECGGVLVAGDAVLTSSICVGPPGFPAEQIAIRPGDPSSPPMAHGARTILSPTVETLGAAIAIVLLDRPVLDALPTWIRTAPAIAGEHLRTVGFTPIDGDPTKTLRDHLPVISGRLEEFLVSENPCGKEEGSVVFDEDTEELVGILINAARCDDPYAGTAYARVLPLRAFIEGVLGTPTDLDAGWGDAGKRLHGSKGKTSTDFRSFCDGGATCSTGVCVEQNGESTCSRTCGTGDRCPSASHCLKAAFGDAGTLAVCADPD